MKKLGVFATEEEQVELKALLKKAQTTPAILLFGKHNLAGDAWDTVKKRCHEIALSHGLPEIQGYYGMVEKGEFAES